MGIRAGNRRSRVSVCSLAGWVGIGLVLGVGLLAAGPALAQVSDGDVIADKFAQDSARAAAERRRREEADMLSRALAERAKQLKPGAEVIVGGSARFDDGSAANKTAGDKAVDDAAAAQGRVPSPAADASQTVSPAIEPTGAGGSSVGETAPQQQGRPVAGSAEDRAAERTGDRVRDDAVRAEVTRRLVEAQRQLELDQVSDRIKRAQAVSKPDTPKQSEPPAAPPHADAPTTASSPAASRPQPSDKARNETPSRYGGMHDRRFQSLKTVPEPATELADRPADGVNGPRPAETEQATRATILLVMQPGRRGIRRVNKLADPVLCVDDTCYISNGPDRDAEPMSRGRAFGTINTLGQRAGACRHSLGCVFRNVDLGERAQWVQPIDLRLMRHDRRRPSRVRIDPTCRTEADRLVCRRPVNAPDYDIWVVSETLAQRAGAQALMRAIDDGLPQSGGYRYQR